MGILADIIRSLAVHGGEDVAAREGTQTAERMAARPVLTGASAVNDLMAPDMTHFATGGRVNPSAVRMH